MNSPQTASIRCQLQKFATTVEETRTKFSDPTAFGHGLAYAPYYERSRTLALFDDLAGTETDIPSDLWREFSRITCCFAEFEKTAGPVYRKMLLDELENFSQEYLAALCYSVLGGHACEATLPDQREIIGFLLDELGKDHNLSDLERFVVQLDNNVDHECGAWPESSSEPDMPVFINTSCNPVVKWDRGTP
ncbi:MAG: hypothetical protein WC586_05340 [Methanoregula sp.]